MLNFNKDQQFLLIFQVGRVKGLRSDFRIQLRYAHTEVQMYVKNPSNQAQEVTFTMVLPAEAFISNFSMILNNGQVNWSFPR